MIKVSPVTTRSAEKLAGTSIGSSRIGFGIWATITAACACLRRGHPAVCDLRRSWARWRGAIGIWSSLSHHRAGLGLGGSSAHRHGPRRRGLGAEPAGPRLRLCRASVGWRGMFLIELIPGAAQLRPCRTLECRRAGISFRSSQGDAPRDAAAPSRQGRRNDEDQLRYAGPCQATTHAPSLQDFIHSRGHKMSRAVGIVTFS